MWQTKIFKTLAAMQSWVDKNDHRVQWERIFVHNAYGVIYRKLRRVY